MYHQLHLQQQRIYKLFQTVFLVIIFREHDIPQLSTTVTSIVKKLTDFLFDLHILQL